jgi:hypothetical protein
LNKAIQGPLEEKNQGLTIFVVLLESWGHGALRNAASTSLWNIFQPFSAARAKIARTLS